LVRRLVIKDIGMDKALSPRFSFAAFRKECHKREQVLSLLRRHPADTRLPLIRVQHFVQIFPVSHRIDLRITKDKSISLSITLLPVHALSDLHSLLPFLKLISVQPLSG